jgi:hypothetical protein
MQVQVPVPALFGEGMKKAIGDHVWYGADEYLVAGINPDTQQYKLEPVDDAGDAIAAEANSIWVDAKDIDDAKL